MNKFFVNKLAFPKEARDIKTLGVAPLGGRGSAWGVAGELLYVYAILWKKGKDPHPQDKIQHLVFTKDPRPLYYKTPPCAFFNKNVCSKAVFGP